MNLFFSENASEECVYALDTDISCNMNDLKQKISEALSVELTTAETWVLSEKKVFLHNFFLRDNSWGSTPRLLLHY